MRWTKVGLLERGRVGRLLSGPLEPVPYCVRVPPPRDLTLYSRQGVAIDEPLIRLGFATRGVVERSRSTPAHEGPDHEVSVVFLAGRTLARLHWQGGYDSTHHALGSPEHHRWFHDTMARPGAQVTVLVDGPEACILGMLEPFERVDLFTVLARAQDSDGDRRREWLELALDLVKQAIDADPGTFADEAGKLAATWTDSRDPRRWPAELATRLRRAQTVMPQLAVLVPAAREASIPVWVEE